MKILYIAVLTLLSFRIEASCLSSQFNENLDLLAVTLREQAICIDNVQSVKTEFLRGGLKTLPAMVANRGAHNPSLGSFSIFESVSGFSKILNIEVLPEHLFFGHFTTLEQRRVILDQESTPQKLMIEVIAYDFKKKVYNFYELVGTSSGPKWFYRGDSFDAYEDNKYLKLNKEPRFGSRMRCSACHNSGGPIMKELDYPHNDWWIKERGLTLGPNSASRELDHYFKNFIDAKEFAKNVRQGIKLLEQSRILKSRSLKEQLRPLFCTTEINLKSDTVSLMSPQSLINIPSEIFVNPFLVRPSNLKMRKDFYVNALIQVGSRFPENNMRDADHGYLAPVKGQINIIQIKELIESALVDEEFVIDVLSIDFESPLFSKSRCALLQLVPESSHWKEKFLLNLERSSLPRAHELALNLRVLDKAHHKERAKKYLKDKEVSWGMQAGVVIEVMKLNELRESVFEDVISRNPRGQILEPGFRVIFPLMTNRNSQKTAHSKTPLR